MTPVAFRARLVRAARNDRPSRETAERVLAAALLVSLETCATPPPRALSAVRDLLRRLLVPLSVVTLAGDPSPPVRPFPPSSAPSAAPIVSATPRSPYTQRVQTVATRTAALAPAVVPAQEE